LSVNENLEKLSNAGGVTGRESEVRELMIKMMTPYADEIVVDKLDNVIAVKKGSPLRRRLCLLLIWMKLG
jgi:endoglucanase